MSTTQSTARHLHRTGERTYDVIVDGEVVGEVRREFIPGLNGRPGKRMWRGYWTAPKMNGVTAMTLPCDQITEAARLLVNDRDLRIATLDRRDELVDQGMPIGKAAQQALTDTLAVRNAR